MLGRHIHYSTLWGAGLNDDYVTSSSMSDKMNG